MNSVYLDVFVTLEGEPVTGLSVDDFQVTDDGVHQTLEMVSLEDIPLETLLVFDVSGSLEGKRLEYLRAAARAAIGGMRPGERAGLIAFADEVHLVVPPTEELSSVDTALQALATASGTTSLYDALFTTLILSGGDRGHGVAIVFSDGKDNTTWLSEEEVLATAEESNVLLHVIGIHPLTGTAMDSRQVLKRPKPPELQYLYHLSEATGGSLWLASSIADLEATLQELLEAMRNRYVLRFEPTSTRPGRHRLEVKLHGKGDVRARPSYFVAP